MKTMRVAIIPVLQPPMPAIAQLDAAAVSPRARRTPARHAPRPQNEDPAGPGDRRRQSHPASATGASAERCGPRDRAALAIETRLARVDAGKSG